MFDDLTAYLADAGLADVRAELRTFFADPDAYDAALPKRLAEALTAAAPRHLAARRSAKALELWNRVLAFDPENAVVNAALRRLEGRARLKHAAAGLAIAAVLAGGGWFTVRQLRHRSPPKVATTTAPAAPPVTVAPVPAPTPPALQPPAADSPARAEPVSAPRAITAAPAAKRGTRPVRTARVATPPIVTPQPEVVAPVATRTFTLGPTPQNVDVYLDGVRQFSYDIDHTKIAVPWAGVHTIELRSPGGCCFVERIEVGPERPMPPDSIIARKLKWRPARLMLTTDPPGVAARLMVRDVNRDSGATAARPGDEIDIPFAADDDASKEIEISATTGDALTTERVRVRAGQRLKHAVKLGAN